MKIHNKRKFYFSLLWLAMGIAIIVIGFVEGEVTFKHIFSTVCCGILGINGLSRSLSQKMTWEDRVEELDERNRLIELKSKRKAFQMMQITLFCIGFFFSIIGGRYQDEILGTVGIVSAAMWSFSLVIDWLTYAYYGMKN